MKKTRASIENTPALLEEETFRALRAFKQWEDRVLDKPENLSSKPSPNSIFIATISVSAFWLLPISTQTH